MEKQNNTLGRRKEAVARVFLRKGNGQIVINGKDYKSYFALVYLQNQVELPLKTIDATENFDVTVTVKGGGVKGQAEAIRLGIARGLCQINEEWRPALKHAGLLMRDPRVVERKKPGQKKARKNFQFSKR
jgi:small subunit ribosomal protein S9